MSGVHHTRVYGGLTNCRPFIEICAQYGFVPDVMFTVGTNFVVATSTTGDLYIRRGPRGPREVSRDPSFFTGALYKKALSALRRHMSDMSQPVRRIQWSPKDFKRLAKKTSHPVS